MPSNARRYYVDMLRECRECSRPSLFFAREQRHWLEEQQFYVDADCIHCSECPARQHWSKEQLARFSKAMGAPNLARRDLMTLIELTFEVGNAQALHSLVDHAARKAVDEGGDRRGHTVLVRTPLALSWM